MLVDVGGENKGWEFKKEYPVGSNCPFGVVRWDALLCDYKTMLLAWKQMMAMGNTAVEHVCEGFLCIFGLLGG